MLLSQSSSRPGKSQETIKMGTKKKKKLRNSQSLFFVTLQQADPAIKSSFKTSSQLSRKKKKNTFRLNEDVSVKLSMVKNSRFKTLVNNNNNKTELITSFI